jgi:hypothetical protein
MDPLSGLLGLTTLSIGSLAFLHWKKQQREGFESVPTENYPLTVADSQTVYNPLSQLLNPFVNGLVSLNPSPSEQASVERNARQALQGVEGDYSLNNSESLNAQISRYFTEPRIDKQGGLLETIQFCREEGKKATPFSNPRFASTCGVCLTDGTDEEGNAFTGPRGLFISEKEKQIATQEKNSTGGLYVKAKPSLGMCTGAPDQPVFATNEKELTLFQKRRECQTKKVVGEGCGVCLNSQTYSYVDKDTDKQSMFMVLAGVGKLTVKVNGKVIEKEDTVLNADKPIKFDLGTEEGSTFELTVKKDPRALLYGYLEASMPNRGIFRVPLQRIITKDEETGSTPSVEPPSYRFSSIGVSSSKLKNANTKDQLRLIGILPFTFPSPGEFVALDCPSTPFQSKKESLSAISADPCANRGNNGYSDECLIQKIYDSGCTNNGSLVQNPSQVNQYGNTLDAIADRLSQIKAKDGVTVNDSKLCSGSEPRTPCEEALLNPTAPLSTECLLYLYNNRGVTDNRIGATYVGNESLASRQADGSLRYCLASGTLSPLAANGSPNTQAINTLNQRALQGFNSLTGIKGVQAFLNSVFVQAVDTTKRIDDPSRAVAIQQCFSQVSSVPSANLASTPTSIADSLWITSRDGFLYKYENKTWTKQPQLASQVAVTPNNRPWYLTTGFAIYMPSGTGYALVRGAARDVGVGANGVVWVIGTNSTGGGFGIYRMDSGNWRMIAGGAVRIAVDPNGNAYVVNNSDQLFQWTGSSWNFIPTAAGKDVAVSSGGTIFVMQPTKLLYKKPSDSTWSTLDAPVGKTLVRISADLNANPYVVTSDSKLFQYNGTYWYEIPVPSQGVLDVGVGTT